MGSNPIRPATDLGSNLSWDFILQDIEQVCIQESSKEMVSATMLERPGLVTQTGQKGEGNKPLSIIQRMRQDEDIDRWWNDLRRSSKTTPDTWLRRLHRFCEVMQIGWQDLARLEEKESFKLRLNAATRFEKLRDKLGKPLSPSYINGILNVTIPAWRTFMGIENVQRWVNITNVGERKRLLRTPSPRLVDTVWKAADKEGKVCISVVAYSGGSRLEVIGDADGMDGIVLGDFPELVLDEPEVRFSHKTPMLIIRRTISKIKRQYFTFLEETHGAWSVIDYLQDRRAKGEILTPESPLVLSTRRKKKAPYFLSTREVSKRIRLVVRKVTKHSPQDYFNPNLLRNFAADRSMLAEDDNEISLSFRQFLFGHSGPMLNQYSLNGRNQLPEEIVEKLRQAFERVCPYLLESEAEKKIKELEASLPEKLEEVKQKTRRSVELEFSGIFEDFNTRLKAVEADSEASQHISERMITDPKFASRLRKEYRTAGKLLQKDPTFEKLLDALREGDADEAERLMNIIVATRDLGNPEGNSLDSERQS
jgi:hypothetical protein